MPSRWRVRKIFKPLVIKMAQGMVKIGMKPNQATMTMLGCSIIALASVLLFQGFHIAIRIYGALVFIAGLMDGVDGSIARITGKVTRFGGILDSSVDRISDAIVFMGPALREFCHGDFSTGSLMPLPWLYIIPTWTWVAILLIGAYMTSYTRARAELAKPGIDMDVGLLGRSERLILIVIGSMLNMLDVFLPIIATCALGTALFRLHGAKNNLKRDGMQRQSEMDP